MTWPIFHVVTFFNAWDLFIVAICMLLKAEHRAQPLSEIKARQASSKRKWSAEKAVWEAETGRAACPPGTASRHCRQPLSQGGDPLPRPHAQSCGRAELHPVPSKPERAGPAPQP